METSTRASGNDFGPCLLAVSGIANLLKFLLGTSFKAIRVLSIYASEKLFEDTRTILF